MQMQQLTGLILKPSNARKETAIAHAMRVALVSKAMQEQALDRLMDEMQQQSEQADS